MELGLSPEQKAKLARLALKRGSAGILNGGCSR
jgi:hypothetical protein